VLRVCRPGSDEELALEILDRAGVLVHPGYFFDFSGEAFLVLSLLTPADVFAEGLEHIIAVL
jgi:aspartate/methionine/tyrosine aminotransferase